MYLYTPNKLDVPANRRAAQRIEIALLLFTSLPDHPAAEQQAPDKWTTFIRMNTDEEDC